MTERPDARHAITRVRHELKRRSLTITRIEALTPNMRRIHFTSPSLSDFVSAAPDDHVKLFFPGSEGEDEPIMRDYTPRAFDNRAQSLTLDFALHEAGAATEWAMRAEVGQTLEIGGPRGSRVISDDFDWYLLIGDESALPAIGRTVETLRADVPVITFACIANTAERQTFATRAAWRPIWVERGHASERDADRLITALSDFVAPPGDGFVWVAGEASIAKAVRAYFLQQREHPRAWLRASGYWQRGEDGAHIELGD